MSDRLPYPTDPTPTVEGLTSSQRSVLTLLRQVFFPRVRGELGLMERVAALEARVADLEKQP